MGGQRREYAEVEGTIRKYEQFIEDKLKADLLHALTERNKIYDQISDYLKLRNDLELIQETQQTAIKTMVDVGCNIYCQAKIPDTSRVYVDVGFGFHVEMTQAEALAFIEKKTKHLERSVEDLTQQSNSIRAHIKLVLDALQELQFSIDRRE